MSCEPLLDGRHNANYGVPPEENLRVLKLKAEVRQLTLFNSVILFLFLIVTVVSVYHMFGTIDRLFNADLMLRNDVEYKFPMLLVDEPITEKSFIRPTPINMVFEVAK